MTRLSVPFAALLAVLALSPLACSGDGGPTAPDRTAPLPPPEITCDQTVCPDISGQWDAGWGVPPCGTDSVTGQATVTQDGCKADIRVSGLGTFSGCVEEVGVQSRFQIRFADGSPGSDDSSCNNAGEAGVTVEEDGTVYFPFAGGGTEDCCRHGFVTLSR